MRTGEMAVKVIACMITIVAIGSAQEARAGVYPTNKCVSAKMTAAAAYCQSTLKAWSTWDKKQDNARRDGALSSAATKLAADWNMAEVTATQKGVDCAQTTLSLTALQSLLDAAVGPAGDVVTEINAGLTLSKKDNAKCGMKLLNAASKKCGSMLEAEATYIKKLGKNNSAANLTKQKTKASDLFTQSWSDATAGGCPTTATKDGIEGKIDDLTDKVVTDTTVSPNVDDSQFTTITPTNPTPYLGKSLEPVCKDGSSYAFFVKRGSVNKLLMYYQGGGACWDEVTCGGTDITKDPDTGVRQALCDTTVDPSGGDNPNNQALGFADRTNPDNPFKDWNIVFVSYCSCDIHCGDADQDYKDYDGTPIHVAHHGFHNAKVAEKWAREHFLNPEVVFVTGSSAGSYGALFNAPLLHKVWPGAKFRVLGDAGNGVITKDFLLNEFPHWNLAANLPTNIPGVKKSFSGKSPTGMVGYIEAVAKYFPETPWAHYATAYDGGMGGQTGFYNVMANPIDADHPLAYAVWPKWWMSSCAWNQLMVQQATETYTAVDAGTKNYRYYIGTGSRHTMWGSNKVYGDTTGGVPTIVSWINAMLAGKDDPGWVNVTAVPDNVLLVYGPGDEDPRPSPLAEPFETSGSDIIVNCP